MAVSRIKGFGVTGFASTSTSVAPSTAAGTVGDIHIAALAVFNQVAVITPPAGWTQIGTQHNGAAQYQMTYWWWVDNGSTTSFTWSWSGAAVDRGVWIEVFRGVHQTTPVQATNFNQGTSATAANTGLTPAVDGGFVLFMNNDNGFVAGSTPAGWTLQNNTLDQAIFTLVPVAAGSGSGALSITISGGSTDWICDLIELQVPPVAAVPPHRMPLGV